MEIAASTNTRWAVITGGEPVIQPELSMLIRQLHLNDFKVAIETSGAVHYDPVTKYVEWHAGCEILDFDVLPDHITLSPKDSIAPTHPALEEWFFAASEFKVVIDRVDHPALDRVLAFRETYGRMDVPVYLQPEFTEMARWTARCMELMKEDSSLRLSLQTHKWIGAR